MEVCYDEETKTWSTRPLTPRKFSPPKVMNKKLVALGILIVLFVCWMSVPGPSSSPICPRGYYLTPGPNSFRRCVPIGETSSEDAIPPVNFTPSYDYNVIQSL